MKDNWIFTYFIVLILAFCFVGCDDTYKSSIPNVPVNLKINLTSEEPLFKNSANKYLLIKTRDYEYDRIGYGGILIYSSIDFDDSGKTKYYSFDMACPYEADRNIKVYPKEDAFGQVVCEKCGSVYEIGYGFGNPSSGPSKEPLKKYHIYIDSYDNLIVSR